MTRNAQHQQTPASRIAALAELAVPLAALAQSSPLEEPFGAVFELSEIDAATGVVIGPASILQPGAAAGVGDVNGDGIDDVAVVTRTGRSYVVFGRRSGTPVVDILDLDGTDGFRASIPGRGIVAPVGDVNHDGVDDMAFATARGTPGGLADAGWVFVVFGRGTGTPFPATLNLFALDGTDGFRLEGAFANAAAGASVALAGDLNGDGVDDLVVGSPGTRHAPDFEGAAHVIFGRDSRAGATFEPIIVLDEPDDGTRFQLLGSARRDAVGTSVDAAGDMNGDGLDDVIAGAPGASGAFVLFGRPAGEPFAATIRAQSLDGTDGAGLLAGLGSSGLAVTSADDFNGDGFGDVVIGAGYASPDGRYNAGAAYVVMGRDTYPPTIRLDNLDGTDGFRVDGASQAFPFEDPGDRFGTSVAGVGDVNGDGLPDLAISAPGGDYGGSYLQGQTYIVYGSPDSFPPIWNIRTLDETIGVSVRGARFEDKAGRSVESAGDFNGDGVADVIIGSEDGQAPDLTGEGATYVLYGRLPCPADVDRDGELTIFDFLAFQDLFNMGDPLADLDRDGSLTVFDFLAYQNAFEAGCE